MIPDLLFSVLFFLVLDQRHQEHNKYLYVRFPHATSSLLHENQIPAVPTDHFRIVVVSDTHDRHHKLLIPSCDLFVHCGDILMTGRLFSRKHNIRKLMHFNQWLATVPATQKIVIAGNHDKQINTMGHAETQMLLNNCVYLENSSSQCGLWTIWGTPLSHGKSSNKAFQSKEFADSTIAQCPETADILITHGPLPEIEQKVRHKVHLYGHQHNSYGVRYKVPVSVCSLEPQDNSQRIGEDERKRLAVCAPVNDGHFRLRQWPVIIDLPNNHRSAFSETHFDSIEQYVSWPPQHNPAAPLDEIHSHYWSTPSHIVRHWKSFFAPNRRVKPAPTQDKPPS